MNPRFDEPVCGVLGCHERATVTINHDRHGRRVVCHEHATGHQVVIEDV